MVLMNLFTEQEIGATGVLKLLYVKVSRHKIHGQSWHAFYEVKEAHSKMLQKVGVLQYDTLV